MILKSLNYARCLNIAPMGKSLGHQGNIASWFIAPFEKAWLCRRLLFKVVIVMVKNKKIQYKRYNVDQNLFYAFM